MCIIVDVGVCIHTGRAVEILLQSQLLIPLLHHVTLACLVVFAVKPWIQEPDR
jgi:hypothetical protein